MTINNFFVLFVIKTKTIILILEFIIKLILQEICFLIKTISMEEFTIKMENGVL
jgi:hypothetical protein